MSRFWISSILALLSLLFCLGFGALLTTVDTTVISLDVEPSAQGTDRKFAQGALLPSDGMFDIAIEGEGFFQINDEYQTVYTRSGNFTLDENGEFVMASKVKRHSIEPAISIPKDAIHVFISRDGLVSYQRFGETKAQHAGQIQLARFENAKGLIRLDDNLFKETKNSGSPSVGNPGKEGRGQLLQGFLEQSNKDSISEVVKPDSRIMQVAVDEVL
ncbi:flagellar basal body rod C-terminal domain-containing protein [Gimesia aquarii]|uniref:Flagellar basal-body rod protein FlgG n=1 Tax=Gimesia aquarii TaxID=2527964 RepID=A0A517W2F3_9PLAN|nr:flagellar basal body rod C-terminal domain-containing protein [Gimesia aquarii]QDT99439.1 Flagellar basal-body rod protein FlgG [Gimesia aquarii]